MQFSKSTERFSDKVENYVKYRPHYPSQIIPFLSDEIGLQKSWTIADIGSGTGISSELFLQNGNRVFGIEPNKEMREAAEKIFSEQEFFKSINGTAENTTLQPHSVDLIIVGQAFHWFDIQKCKKEFNRILTKGGYCVLIWNDRKTETTGFLIDYEKLLQDFGTDYKEVNHKKFDENVLGNFFGEKNFKTKSFPNFQHFDYEGLEGRLLSSSYVPRKGENKFDNMIKELHLIFKKWNKNEKVTIQYDTKMFYGVIKR